MSDNKDKKNVYGKAANGRIPVVVHVENEVCFVKSSPWSFKLIFLKYDIAQLMKVKTDYPDVNIVIMGGSGAPLVSHIFISKR